MRKKNKESVKKKEKILLIRSEKKTRKRKKRARPRERTRKKTRKQENWEISKQEERGTAGGRAREKK